MWGVAFGAVLSLGACAASAQITAVVTSRTVDSTSALAPHVAGSVDNGAGQYFTPIGSSPVYNNYNSYQVSTVVEPNYVAFANNATIAGGAGIGSSITSSTSIAVTFTNTTGQSITPTLESTILPGGFGFYAGDLTSNPKINNGVVNDINLTPQSKTVNLTQLLAGYAATPVWNEGNVSFSFQILQGATVLANYTGSASLNLLENCTPTCSAPYAVQQTGITNVSTPLNNFGRINVSDPNGAVLFRWDETPVAVPLGTIAAGDSTILSYVTSVTASIQNPGFFGDQAPIAYVGFGDPIGSSGGSGSVNGAGFVNDPNFPLLQYNILPTYDSTTNQLTSGQFMGYTRGGFPVTDTTLTSSSSTIPPPTLPIDPTSLLPAVPEPEAWVLMVAGIGLTGGMLRSRTRRRVA
jgi:hypothetical protein